MEDGSHGSGLPNTPFWDTTINYIPIVFPLYKPATITMQSGNQEFWRVVNADANTILDLQVVYDGVPQPLQIVASPVVASRASVFPSPKLPTGSVPENTPN